MYGANAISKAVARLENRPASARTLPPPGEHGAPSVARIEDPALEARLREAVLPWTTGSNGKAEAKAFRLEPALTLASPGRWLLRALALDCVDGAEALHAERTSADDRLGARSWPPPTAVLTRRASAEPTGVARRGSRSPR